MQLCGYFDIETGPHAKRTTNSVAMIPSALPKLRSATNYVTQAGRPADFISAFSHEPEKQQIGLSHIL